MAGLSLAAPLLAETMLIDFKINDQFDREYLGEDYRGSITLLVGSGREASEHNERWGEAIRGSFEEGPEIERVKVLRFAHLTGVPFFLKDIIKAGFPKDRDAWVLLDWKGRFCEAYDLDPQMSNILVFAPDGRLVHQAAGLELDEETV